jgi:hypothetical protein
VQILSGTEAALDPASEGLSLLDQGNEDQQCDTYDANGQPASDGPWILTFDTSLELELGDDLALLQRRIGTGYHGGCKPLQDHGSFRCG